MAIPIVLAADANGPTGTTPILDCQGLRRRPTTATRESAMFLVKLATDAPHRIFTSVDGERVPLGEVATIPAGRAAMIERCLVEQPTRTHPGWSAIRDLLRS